MKKKPNITIHEIAKAIDISASTVSRALNNNKSISQKTKEKVWDAAKRMGYFPELPEYMKNSAKQVVVLVDSFNSPTNDFFMINFSKGLQSSDIALQVKYVCDENELLDFIAKQETGLLVSLLSEKVLTATAMAKMEDRNLKFVVCNLPFMEGGVLNLVPDYYNGAQIAMKHLKNQKATNFILLLKEEVSLIQQEIKNGFESTFESENFTLTVLRAKSETRELNYLFEQLWEAGSLKGGVICENNLMACQLISFLKAKQVSVPDEMMVVAFGDEAYAEHLFPGLTTVSYDIDALGSRTATVVIDLLDNIVLDQKMLVWPLKLVVRGSSSNNIV